MKKKIYTFLAIVMLALTSWVPGAMAQNKVFEKYSDMEDVEYICITQSMLSLLGGDKNSATINGVHIEGITKDIKIILIISSEEENPKKQMKKDFQTLKASNEYDILMDIREGKERITTLCNSKNAEKEIIMNISDSDGSQTFIVLTGTFTDTQIKKLLGGK